MVTVNLPTPPDNALEEPTSAAVPDDDSIWRAGGSVPKTSDPTANKKALLAQCEERLGRAMLSERARTLIQAIRAGDCTALKPPYAKCATCRADLGYAEVGGYYNPRKGVVVICAEKEPTQRQVEDTLVHELVAAYDHCRQGTRVPFVGWQAPWALSCAATACSEVRGYLLGSFQRHTPHEPRGMQNGALIGEQHGDELGGSFARESWNGGDTGAGAFGSDVLLTDGNLGDGGMSGGASNDGAGAILGSNRGYGSLRPQPPATDPDALRTAVYQAALLSTSGHGRQCVAEGKDPRVVSFLPMRNVPGMQCLPSRLTDAILAFTVA
jgi:hypothetical protein